MAEKPKGYNPQLNYRVEKRIQDEYKAVCKENCLDPGKLIRQFMLDTIEVLTVSDCHDKINSVRKIRTNYSKGGNKK